MIDKKNKALDFAKSIKKKILTTAYNAGAKSAHVGGALSCVDLISSLFVNYNIFNSKNFKDDDSRDRFILSKGHACLAYYSALNEIGLISDNEMKTFEEDGSNLLGHPVINKDIGIEFSTGSLGMGLSIGIGLAIASQKKNKNFKTFVLMGDGECNEGSVWEAAMSAPNLKVKNLLAIIDKNKFQQTGTNSEIMNIDPIEDKWKAFGWNVMTLNGHDIPSILSYFETIDFEKPNLLVANTIKGKGFSFSENNNAWHHGVISKKIYEHALNEIEEA
jgi:transketolase